jgi:hypothetical protein
VPDPPAHRGGAATLQHEFVHGRDLLVDAVSRPNGVREVAIEVYDSIYSRACAQMIYPKRLNWWVSDEEGRTRPMSNL